MTMKKFFLLSLTLMIFSCTNNQADGGDTVDATVEDETESIEMPKEMESREWMLIKYEEAGTSYNLQGAEEVTIKFNRGKCFGIGGCNNYGASYTLTGKGTIEFGEIGATKKICNSIMGQEIKYFKLLKESTSYDYKDALLTLNGPGGKLTYRYKMPESDN